MPGKKKSKKNKSQSVAAQPNTSLSTAANIGANTAAVNSAANSNSSATSSRALPARGILSEADLKHKSKSDIHSFEKQARAGDKHYQFLMGVLHLKGWNSHVSIDGALARKYFLQAASQGMKEAYYNLAIIYEQGKAGVTIDEKAAFQYYLNAAKLGHIKAQNTLGLAYRNGNLNQTKNDKHAFFWFQLAASLGDLDSRRQVFIAYEDGKGVEKNQAKAIEWLKKMAFENNDAAAQCELALYHTKEGIYGVPQDIKYAKELYSMAAKQNHPAAIVSLAALNEEADLDKTFSKQINTRNTGNMEAKQAADRLLIRYIKPLQVAALAGELTFIKKLLTDKVLGTVLPPWLLLKENQEKYALLHHAAQGKSKNQTQIVDYFIKLKFDVNLKDSDQNTPIIYAVSSNNHGSFDLLIQNGAFITNTNGQGSSLFCIALQCEILCERTLQQVITACKTKMEPENFETHIQEALCFASSLPIPETNPKQTIEIMQVLWSASSKHKNPLILLSAARFNRSAIVQWLLSTLGFDIDGKVEGVTALMTAATYNHHTMVSQLLQMGADYTLVDNDNIGAYGYAMRNRNQSMIAALQKPYQDHIQTMLRSSKESLELLAKLNSEQQKFILHSITDCLAKTYAKILPNSQILCQVKFFKQARGFGELKYLNGIKEFNLSSGNIASIVADISALMKRTKKISFPKILQLCIIHSVEYQNNLRKTQNKVENEPLFVEIQFLPNKLETLISQYDIKSHNLVLTATHKKLIEKLSEHLILAKELMLNTQTKDKISPTILTQLNAYLNDAMRFWDLAQKSHDDIIHFQTLLETLLKEWKNKIETAPKSNDANAGSIIHLAKKILIIFEKLKARYQDFKMQKDNIAQLEQSHEELLHNNQAIKNAHIANQKNQMLEKENKHKEECEKLEKLLLLSQEAKEKAKEEKELREKNKALWKGELKILKEEREKKQKANKERKDKITTNTQPMADNNNEILFAFSRPQIETQKIKRFPKQLSQPTLQACASWPLPLQPVIDAELESLKRILSEIKDLNNQKKENLETVILIQFALLGMITRIMNYLKQTKNPLIPYQIAKKFRDVAYRNQTLFPDILAENFKQTKEKNIDLTELAHKLLTYLQKNPPKRIDRTIQTQTSIIESSVFSKTATGFILPSKPSTSTAASTVTTATVSSITTPAHSVTSATVSSVATPTSIAAGTSNVNNSSFQKLMCSKLLDEILNAPLTPVALATNHTVKAIPSNAAASQNLNEKELRFKNIKNRLLHQESILMLLERYQPQAEPPYKKPEMMEIAIGFLKAKMGALASELKCLDFTTYQKLCASGKRYEYYCAFGRRYRHLG